MISGTGQRIDKTGERLDRTIEGSQVASPENDLTLFFFSQGLKLEGKNETGQSFLGGKEP